MPVRAIPGGRVAGGEVGGFSCRRRLKARQLSADYWFFPFCSCVLSRNRASGGFCCVPGRVHLLFPQFFVLALLTSSEISSCCKESCWFLYWNDRLGSRRQMIFFSSYFSCPRRMLQPNIYMLTGCYSDSGRSFNIARWQSTLKVLTRTLGVAHRRRN